MAYVMAGGTAEGPQRQDRGQVPPTAASSTAPSPALADEHLKLIKSRFFQQFLETPGPAQGRAPATAPQHRPAGPSAESIADAQNVDGSWPDLDYAASSKGGGPAPSIQHLYRLLSMVKSYRTEASPQYRSETLARKISVGISFWIQANPLADHAWYDTIGVPLCLGKILILFEDRLTREQLRGALPILKRANQNGLLFYAIGPATGENLIWQAMIQVLAGALEGDATYVATFARQAEQEIALDTPEGAKKSRTVRDPLSNAMDTPEGIQPDYSFHQHGPLLYSGGYGQGFAVDCAVLASVLRDTPQAFSKPTVELLGQYILDGQRWMLRGSQWDFGAVGRELARAGKNARGLARACDQMKELWPARAAEFEAMARGLRGQGSLDLVEGNRLFWRSDFMAHQRAGFYASARMCSTRIKSNESGNGENILGYHLGHGATCLMRTGEEYRDLMPFWDWQMLPGVTCARSDKPLPQTAWGRGAFQESPFAGGVSDGRYGVAAMEFVKAGLRARKAWFFLDEQIVCLGAGIQNQGPEPVHTTVNQCRLLGEMVGPGGTFDPEKVHSLKGPTWVLHDGWAYVFPDARTVRVAGQTRHGSWRDVSTVTGLPDKLTDRVFSVWMDHGRAPKGAAYHYVVIPGGDAKIAVTAIASSSVKVLANTSDLQAVGHAGLRLTQAVFHQAGQLQTAEGLTVAVDRPCLLMVRLVADTVELCVSDPAQEAAQLAVRLDRALTGDGVTREGSTTTVSIRLPAGPQAGSTDRRVLYGVRS